jgi:hypothetical protein
VKQMCVEEMHVERILANHMPQPSVAKCEVAHDKVTCESVVC